MTAVMQDYPILSNGERIVWEGAPKSGFWLEPADIFAVPFSIFWLATVLLIFGVIGSGGATELDPAAYVVLPLFVLFGLYLVVGRFFLARLLRDRTRYFLTNRRAIIRSGLLRRNERSVSLVAVGEIRLSAIRDGFGTIEFGQSNPLYRMMPRSWGGQFSALAPAFEQVADVQTVYHKIIELQAALGRN